RPPATAGRRGRSAGSRRGWRRGGGRAPSSSRLPRRGSACRSQLAFPPGAAQEGKAEAAEEVGLDAQAGGSRRAPHLGLEAHLLAGIDVARQGEPAAALQQILAAGEELEGDGD